MTLANGVWRSTTVGHDRLAVVPLRLLDLIF
jgi:hypothetical protein